MEQDVYRRKLWLAALWRRLRRIANYRTYVLSTGGLNYDLLSYSQNFDDGKICECEPGFLARFAAREAGVMPTPVVVVNF